jgi:hypothetical protein
MNRAIDKPKEQPQEVITMDATKLEDLGHFHVTGPEFWFVLEGRMEFRIGSVPMFVADQGDIAYAPAPTWHRVRFAGTGMATWIAVVGYANSERQHLFGDRQDCLNDRQAGIRVTSCAGPCTGRSAVFRGCGRSQWS